MNPYESHKPILKFMLHQIDPNGFVLECGGGQYSTPIICNHNGPTMTLENDKNWYKKISGYNKNNHVVKLVNNWEEEFVKLDNIEMVFIDQGVWQDRCYTIEVLKNKAKYLVLHDAFHKHLNLCNPFSLQFCVIYYQSLTNPGNPPTMVGSNIVDIDFDIPGFNKCYYER